MKRFMIMIVSGLMSLGSSLASANEEADISPRVVGNQIVTDAFIDATGEQVEGVRVFSWAFGEIVENPFAISDPGFNALADVSGLTPGSRIGFRVLSDLLYWDGTAAVTFGPVVDDETLEFSFLGASRTVGTGTGELPEMFFGPAVSSNGGFHTHLNTLLYGADGNIDPAVIDGIEPTTGLYLVQWSLVSTDPEVIGSQPLFLVFNHGLDETQVDLATGFIKANLVPQPQSWLLLTPLLAMGASRRVRLT